MKTATQPTYVLFGKKAIELYKLSIDHLVMSNDLKYNVGTYTDVSSFVADKNCWNDFTIISKTDYTRLIKHINENKSNFSFVPFFDTIKKSFAYQLV